MSRIGKKPVAIPQGVNAEMNGQTITAKGPKGELSLVVNEQVLLKMAEGEIQIEPVDDSKEAKAFWGMSRTMIENIMIGVNEGFMRKLEINGVGFRAAMQGNKLQLTLGFSHEVIYNPPDNVAVKCTKPTEIEITGADKQVVGQVAAEIRAFRPPEPYKGKGIKYAEETIFRKEGKKK